MKRVLLLCLAVFAFVSTPNVAHAITCPYNACDRFDPDPALAKTKTSRGSNSQVNLPRGMYFGDVDGDGQSDYIQMAGNKVFATRTNNEKDGLSHFYGWKSFPRLMVGDFRGFGRDQVCTLGSELFCYGIDPTPNQDGVVDPEFRLWFHQSNFIEDDEDVIVGDFDKDHRDEALLYNRKTGAFRMWEVDGKQDFTRKSEFNPGNLRGRVDEPGVRFAAGDYHGDGQTDLVGVRSNGSIYVFRGVNSGGETTFWWAFNTASGRVNDDDQVLLARVDDDAKDDLVIHDKQTGKNSFHKVTSTGGDLPGLDVDQGQIRERANSLLVMVKSHKVTSEAGSDVRDDAFVFDLGNSFIYRSSARYSTSTSRYTYWWAHNHEALDFHTGWAAPVVKEFESARCKFKDEAGEPISDDYWNNLLPRAYAFFNEVTYGTYDLWGSAAHEDYAQTNLAFTGAPTPTGRVLQANACMDAVDYDGDKDGFITVMNKNGADVSSSGSNVIGNPSLAYSMFLTHEMAHVLGWTGHSFDDSPRKIAGWADPGQYYDLWDIMSANVLDFTDAIGSRSGPGFNSYWLARKGLIPEARTKLLVSGTEYRTTTLWLAPVSRPEANGYLRVNVDVGEEYSYDVEFREPSFFDRGIGPATVLLRKVKGGKSTLITDDGSGNLGTRAGARRLPGESYTVDGMTLRVLSIDTDAHRAQVEITY